MKNSDKLITFRLHNGDSLFQEIRDNNIAFLGRVLKEKVSQIKRIFHYRLLFCRGFGNPAIGWK